MNEFEIIKKYFATQMKQRADVVHGIGDDAAIVNVLSKNQLAVTTDTLVAGVHFLENGNPFDIGYKSLAVNLSDLAAMAATPAWVTLALTLPQAADEWLQAFCEGFFALANQHQVQLIGGDLNHGPLSITVQALGLIPDGQALLRSNAKPGDLIYVTGTLGDAGLALQYLQKKTSIAKENLSSVLQRLNQPQPQIKIGEKLRTLAHAVIDISDGLVADLKHILEASHVGAELNVDAIPLSAAMNSLSKSEAINLALTAGDDYELCFTIPENNRQQVEKECASLCRITCIGKITQQTNLNLHYDDGSNYNGPIFGYQHF